MNAETEWGARRQMLNAEGVAAGEEYLRNTAALFTRAAVLARQMAEIQREIAPSLAKIYGGDDCGAGFTASLHDAVAALLEAEAAHQFGPTAEAIELARTYLGGAS